MVEADDHVTVMDFGIAKAATHTALTTTGRIFGTPEYMSPEQAEGLEEPDARSDVYSLGVVVYEMFTGEVPFSGTTPLSIMRGHADKPPPRPSEIKPDVTPAVEAVLLKALAKRQEARYQSAGEIAQALEEATEARVEVTPIPLKREAPVPPPVVKKEPEAEKVAPPPVKPAAMVEKKPEPPTARPAPQPAPKKTMGGAALLAGGLALLCIVGIVIVVISIGPWPTLAVPAPPAEEPAPPTEAPSAAPAEGKTFIFGRGGDSVQLDPAVVTDVESFRVTGQVLESLLQYEDGGTRPIPALAESWEVSEDGTEWTFHLRQGVKFHDGIDFDAYAVVLNFERQWKTDHPLHFESQVYEYWEWMFNGFDDDCLITGINVVDDYTVKFFLREPLAPLLANLAMDMFAISSPAALEAYGEDYGTPGVGAVGTGPFKFVEWVEDDHITVEANEDYWGGKPTIAKIIWYVIPEDVTRYVAFLAGDIHGLEQANIEDLKDCEADPNCYVQATGLSTAYLAFNYHIKELQDPRVREAIFHAIDREALREAFYGDYARVASTFLHPSMWGRPDLEDWTYDPELSKQLLAEAGFPDGLRKVHNEDTGEVGPLKLYYVPITRPYYPSPKEIGEAMAADLAKVGIEIELVLEGDWVAYRGAQREGRLYGLYMLGWVGDNGDPDNFLCYFFCNVTEEEAKEGWYVNPELAELLKSAAVVIEAREEMYKQAEYMLHEDRARLWVMHSDTPRLFSSKVSGFVVQPVGADKYERVVIAD